MSQDKPSNGKRSLKILDKGMMPEILPDPMQAKSRVGAGSPRDRVLKRFVQITERAAAIAAAASISTACSDSHTAGDENNGGGSGMVGAGSGGVAASGGGAGAGRGGAGAGSGGGGTAGYGVVDPLPPPAGSGGYGGGTVAGSSGIGGEAGYGVVDPLPPPFMCPEDPASLIDITAVVWSDTTIVINAQVHDQNGFYAESLTMVQVPDGIVATIVQPNTQFVVRLEPTNGLLPITFDVYLGFTCNGTDGVVNYQIGLSITTSAFGEPTYELIPNDNDAGI